MFRRQFMAGSAMAVASVLAAPVRSWAQLSVNVIGF
ncbi:MAG: twin-arginine translocation signal domain-containing protein, partial [Saezia sp.]